MQNLGEYLLMIDTINAGSLLLMGAITTGLVEAFKQFMQDDLEVANKFLPIVSVVIGLAVSLLWSTQTPESLVLHIFAGVSIGLIGSGLFDVRKIFRKDEEQNKGDE